MKKLLVVLLALSFVLGFSILAAGAIKFEGEVQSEYKFTDNEQNSSVEIDMSAPVSSSVTAYAAFDLEGEGFEVDEAFFKIKTGFGNIFVGQREQGLYTNEVLDENDSTWGDVIGMGLITWEYAFSSGFYVNASYMRFDDGDATDFGLRGNEFLDGGYMAGIGFKAANWELAYYLMSPDVDTDAGYAILFEIEPASWLKLYATFAAQTDVDDDADVGVVGFEVEFGALSFAFDWDTVDDASPNSEDANYGYKIEYELTNKVALEFTQINMYNVEDDEMNFSQELEVKVEF